jgi:hypothetical protein
MPQVQCLALLTFCVGVVTVVMQAAGLVMLQQATDRGLQQAGLGGYP